MKIFIFPLTLVLSLGLTGWMFASYRQNQEQFRQAGQKTADLEKKNPLWKKKSKNIRLPSRTPPPRTCLLWKNRSIHLNSK